MNQKDRFHSKYEAVFDGFRHDGTDEEEITTALLNAVMDLDKRVHHLQVQLMEVNGRIAELEAQLTEAA